MDITTLEPTQVSGWTDHTAALAVFGSLTFNFDGKTGEVGYYPYLAKRVEPIDDLTWEVELREGMTFHNGEPLNAEAVKFSLDRVTHPNFPSGRYLHSAPITEVEIVDELTARIHTSEPLAILYARLLRADGYLVSPTAYAGGPPWSHIDETATRPVGAGPFRFEKHVPGERLVLAVNRGFTDPRGHPRPNFDSLELRVVPDGAEALRLLARREVDIVPISADAVAGAESLEGVRVVSGPDTSRMSFEINQDAHEALRDVRVRRAIQHAIDVEKLRIEHTSGHGVRLPTLVNPPNVHSGIEPYPYDPARARGLLEQAGWQDGFEIDVHWSVAERNGKLAGALVPYLEAVSIHVRTVEELDWDAEYQPRQKNGTLAALHGHGHGGVEMTVETDLWPHHPDRPANSMNWRGAAADRFRQVYAELQSEVQADRQRLLGRTLQEILHEEAVSVVLWQSARFVAVSDRVAHYRPYLGGHNEDFWTFRMA